VLTPLIDNEVKTDETQMFSCEIVWKNVHTNRVTKECGEPAEYMATIHGNANSTYQPHVVISRFVCKACLKRINNQKCEDHQCSVLISWTPL
jgi:hypothetical protein